MNKIVVLIVVASLLITGCANQATLTCGASIRQTPNIFVVSAFGTELQATKEVFQPISTCAFAGIEYHLSSFEGRAVILYLSGVGPAKATESTETTLENFEVELMVFSGIAGALNPSLRVGDTLVPDRWQDMDTGGSVTIDQDLIDIASPLATMAATGLTADHFVDDGWAVYSTYHADIVDMETFSVATVTQAENVPFIAVRSISDAANGEKDGDHYQLASTESAKATAEFIQLYLAQNEP